MKILTVGKGSVCDITLPKTDETQSVSRYHLDITASKTSGLYLIVDKNSTNGTYIHENRIKQAEVAPTEIIRLGLYSTTIEELLSKAAIRYDGKTQVVCGGKNFRTMKRVLRDTGDNPYRDPETGEIVL